MKAKFNNWKKMMEYYGITELRREDPNNKWCIKKSRNEDFEITTDGVMLESELKNLEEDLPYTNVAVFIKDATWAMIYKRDSNNSKKIFITLEEKISKIFGLPNVNEREIGRLKSRLESLEEKEFNSLIELNRELKLIFKKTYSVIPKKQDNLINLPLRFFYYSFPYPHLETGEFCGKIRILGVNSDRIIKIYSRLKNLRFKSINEMIKILKKNIPECEFPIFKISIGRVDCMKGKIHLDLQILYSTDEYMQTYKDFWTIEKKFDK